MTELVDSLPPIVSVVIPSRNAGSDLFRAIASVRKQTYTRVEVIVVLDNASPLAQVLTDLQSAVEKVIQTTTPVGGSGARNLGIAAATGEWIALLDDDDEWVDTKLQMQMEAAMRFAAPVLPVISTRVLAQQSGEQRLWPAKPPPAGNSALISEYLFVISGPTKRNEGFVQTSTLLAPRELFQIVPFTEGLKIHQDWDWLLRASAQAGFHLEMIWEPLTLYYLNAKGTSVSQTKDWRPSFAWATGNPFISRRAYGYFLATVVARYLPISSLPVVAWAFLRRSRMEARSALLFFIFFSFPDEWRVRAARWLRTKK